MASCLWPRCGPALSSSKSHHSVRGRRWGPPSQHPLPITPAGHVSFDTNPSRTGADLASGPPATLAMLPLLAELVFLCAGQESFAIFVWIFISHFSSTVITIPRGDSQNTCQPISTAPASIPTAAWRTRHLSLSTLLLGPPLRQFWVIPSQACLASCHLASSEASSCPFIYGCYKQNLTV